MSNTQEIGYAAKQAALSAIVDGKTLKGALYFAASTTNGSNTVYTTTGEATGTGYSAGGVSVTNANTAGLTTTTTFWTPSASIVFTTVTIAAFDAIMIYSTTDTNRNIGVFTFGTQTVTAGTFTLVMPTNNSTTGLIRAA